MDKLRKVLCPGRGIPRYNVFDGMVLIGELKYEAEADALIAARLKQYQAMAEAKASEKKN
ncbi:hypothetical protein [Pseudomonas putida]|uniref:Uncharacterized protein n=1 Tax=Pseudomonas putida TaxID=303 RepID=A0A2C5VY28_PSEPU|nr:hypothetical protein [Pseudomonas putida]PHH38705.1 hypothetical protein CRX57_00455 [Pseudomonas putida]